mgnify:FL=1
MKTRRLSLLALSSALFLALPVLAQQGPAGVPGAPLLGAEIAPPPPPASEQPASILAEVRPKPEKPQVIAQCRKAKNIKRCEEHHLRRVARQEARAACKTQPQHKRKSCVNRYLKKRAKK